MKQTQYKSDRQKYCHECSAVIVRHADICPVCGEAQQVALITSLQKLQPRSGKSHIAAGILALVLGNFGAHRFYMGQWKLALLYLAFSWTIIPGFIGFVEGVIYLVQGEEIFEKRLNEKGRLGQ